MSVGSFLCIFSGSAATSVIEILAYTTLILWPQLVSRLIGIWLLVSIVSMLGERALLFLRAGGPHVCHSHIQQLQAINEAQVCRAWCAAEIAHWYRLEGYLPAAIRDNEDLSRVESAYHNFFALAPATCSSWSDPATCRNTDHPPLPRYLCPHEQIPLCGSRPFSAQRP